MKILLRDVYNYFIFLNNVFSLKKKQFPSESLNNSFYTICLVKNKFFSIFIDLSIKVSSNWHVSNLNDYILLLKFRVN